ncbi:exosortase C-terminal domain/associated protein EpsI [Granulicella sp. L46]|uniref:exosortase C-terminal domain/associated protein EpsI n=1 Tax=Granulicella sp. L46 TaxID=1641865 RepID=UPI00131C9E94|nr:exosortase C-terminal domain/associated protein EpsI [Granulicella sp. L46]
MKSPRFWVVLLLLLAAFTTLHLRASVDRVPPSEPLNLLPQTIDSWSSQDVPISQDTLDILGDGRFLNRLYTKSMPSGRLAEPPVSLFIGYFPTQRTGQSIHSPQNCLPGAGWTFVSSGKIYLQGPELKNYAVGQYVIANGTAKQVVLYWYLAHGRSIANDYVAKAYMMADAIRYNRTDGALVRLVTPLEPNESFATAQARVVKFADRLVPTLPRFIPN